MKTIFLNLSLVLSLLGVGSSASADLAESFVAHREFEIFATPYIILAQKEWEGSSTPWLVCSIPSDSRPIQIQTGERFSILRREAIALDVNSREFLDQVRTDLQKLGLDVEKVPAIAQATTFAELQQAVKGASFARITFDAKRFGARYELMRESNGTTLPVECRSPVPVSLAQIEQNLSQRGAIGPAKDIQ